jgi:hypothetical protein
MPASADQVEVSGTAFVDVGVKAHGSGPPRYALGALFNRRLPKQFPANGAAAHQNSPRAPAADIGLSCKDILTKSVNCCTVFSVN